MIQNDTSLSDAQILTSLVRLKGVGNRKALDLLAAMPERRDSTDTHQVFISFARDYPGTEKAHEDIWNKSVQRVQDSHDIGVRIITFNDSEYPERLRRTPDPPAVLFVKGQVEALHQLCSVAIVGTRKPSIRGERAAWKAGTLAAESDVSVVSGLALGCDARAHGGCVEREGIGVAVLAHGLDRVYPAANRDLAERILEFNGCLVSEYPVGAGPSKWAFAYRDRIQSGLSDRVLVIETDVKGGTMHTVRYAKEQERPLGCIDLPARGNRKLIGEETATSIYDEESLSYFLTGSVALAEEYQEPALDSEEVNSIEDSGQMRWTFGSA